MNDPRFSNFKFQPSLVAQWIKVPVLVSDLHELKVRVPALERSVRMHSVSSPTLSKGPGGKASFSICVFQKLRLPRGGPH